MQIALDYQRRRVFLGYFGGTYHAFAVAARGCRASGVCVSVGAQCAIYFRMAYASGHGGNFSERAGQCVSTSSCAARAPRVEITRHDWSVDTFAGDAHCVRLAARHRCANQADAWKIPGVLVNGKSKEAWHRSQYTQLNIKFDRCTVFLYSHPILGIKNGFSTSFDSLQVSARRGQQRQTNVSNTT